MKGLKWLNKPRTDLFRESPPLAPNQIARPSHFNQDVIWDPG